MATPIEAAKRLASRLPPGDILELCCGVGGLTRVLARDRKVVAVDQNIERIEQARANISGLGLSHNVDFLCCDLESPAISPCPGRFRIVIMDPDWSALGDPSNKWTDDLGQMRPAADRLIRWAQGWRCMVIMRMPPFRRDGELIQYGYFHRYNYKYKGLTKFTWVIWGS